MKWFDRHFDFPSADKSAATVERLKRTPVALSTLTAGLSEDLLNEKPSGKWSIKEHIGHLITLEPLWRARFGDISESKPVLTAADLDNNATTEGNFNSFSVTALLEKFQSERVLMLDLLHNIDLNDGSSSSLHPRLQQKMRYADHAFFVAEHDEHHLNAIREMIHS
jgi:uncharacterized damage-inducible protein DinB